MYIHQASMEEQDYDYEYMKFGSSSGETCKNKAIYEDEPDYVPMDGADDTVRSVGGVDIEGAQHVLARALYDNNAEAPDELSFRKGDIVTVLEQNTSGLEGWWLCSLNGRQGIAPGNRLKILAGMYESPHSPPPSQTAHKIKTPLRVGQSYIYDSPSSFHSARQDDYDVPPIRGQGYNPQNLGYQTVPGPSRKTLNHQVSSNDTYDVPPNLQATKSPSPTEVYDFPANYRKQSIDELYDSPKKQQPQQETYDVLPASKESKVPMEIYDSPPMKGKGMDSPPKSPTEVYDVPSSLQAKQVSGAVRLPPSPEKTALSNGNTANSLDLYDTLPGQKYPTDVYDVPPMHEQSVSSAKRPSVQNDARSSSEDLYNRPSNTPFQGVYESPSKTKITVQESSDHVYDIPPQVTRDQPMSGRASPVHRGSVDDIDDKMNLLSLTRLTRSVDNLVESSGDMNNELDMTAAMELLSEKQQVLETAIAYLMSYVSSTWRHQSNLDPRIHEIKSACKQLKLALEEFLEFADRCLVNAAKHSDEIWPGKLGKSVQTLREMHASMVKSHAALDEINWQVSKLVYKPGSNVANELDQIALSARSVSDDMKRFASLIQENASSLFRPPFKRNLSSPQERPLPTPPATSTTNANWLSPEKEVPMKGAIQSRPLPQLPPGGIPNPEQTDDLDHTPNKEGTADYGYLTKKDPLVNKQIIVTDPGAKQPSILSPNDKQILAFYVNDVESLVNTMSSAIDLFFTCIEANQPPKVFVAHSKHIILIGHKLVFIGDTLHHNLQHQEVRSRIIRCSDTLCDWLNGAVNTTKAAALQYPAVAPLQEMVDRITDAANATRDLKAAILQCAAL